MPFKYVNLFQHKAIFKQIRQLFLCFFRGQVSTTDVTNYRKLHRFIFTPSTTTFLGISFSSLTVTRLRDQVIQKAIICAGVILVECFQNLKSKLKPLVIFISFLTKNKKFDITVCAPYKFGFAHNSDVIHSTLRQITREQWQNFKN